jgi:hypothetical protein
LNFEDLKVFSLTFFSIKLLFSGYRAIRDIAAHRLILPRLHRRPLVFITIERRCKKNCENHLCFHAFSVVSLTFFSIKMLFSGYRAIRDITAHRWFFSPPTLPPVRVYYNKALTKKEW